jgi:hypothetical protein
MLVKSVLILLKSCSKKLKTTLGLGHPEKRCSDIGNDFDKKVNFELKNFNIFKSMSLIGICRNYMTLFNLDKGPKMIIYRTHGK